MKWLYTLILMILLLPRLVSGSDCSAADTTTGCAAGEGRTEAVFRYDGKEFYENDLNINVRERLHQLAQDYYEARRQLMDNAVWQIFLAQEAERQNKSPEQTAMEMLKLVSPSDEEMRIFYQANQEKISAPFDQVKRQISQFLIQQQAVERRERLIASVKEKGQYQFLIEKPQPPVSRIETDGYPSKGSSLAPVEIVEFADYQCPHCKTSSEIMRRLLKRFGDRIRVVFMDFPINRSGISLKVAEGAVCADRQGRFWDYHDGAFEIQTSLSANSSMELAERIGLDRKRFSDCLAGPEAGDKVARSKAEALRLGLDSTPSFFVNGVRLRIQSDLEQGLADAIEAALLEAGG